MEWAAPELSPDVARRVDRLGEDLELERRLEPYAGRRWAGEATALPALHLDDFSELPFLDGILGVESYQHRARTRTLDGELFAAVVPVTDGYEEYCRDALGLGTVRFVHCEPAAGPLGVARACREPAALAQIAERARSAGGLLVHPFMGIESVWELAAAIARAAQVPVQVVGPPPPVTWIANDKAHFSEVVERTLGSDWLVETRASRDAGELAALLSDLASRHRQVALKRLRCVSGMGNAIFGSAELLDLGPAGVRSEVERFLERTDWEGDEDVQAVAWEDAPVSPSTQLWIPPFGTAPVRLDGIYEQLLEGPERVFAGSRPSTLPAAVDSAIADGALRVAASLQRLGYAGRCSFDLLLLGDPEGEFQVRFVECNGRWGGTSTPMNLIDRLIAGPRPRYRAQDIVHCELRGAAFRDVLARAGSELFDPKTGRGTFIFYNVGPLERFGKLDVIAFGRTQGEADEAVAERLPRLLGL